MRDFSDLIGVPFEMGGRGPKSYDCYGLVRELARRWDGVSLPDYTSPADAGRISALFALELRLWQSCERRPGAVALIHIPGHTHCGYVLDNLYMLHTWQASGGVVRERLFEWQRRIKGFYRYVGS